MISPLIPYFCNYNMKHFSGLFLLLWSSSLIGQTHYTIIDSVTGEPIPYAHIIYSINQGKYSNEDGIVVVPKDVFSIEISHISYESLSLNLLDYNDSSIRLTPVITMLPPAIVRPTGQRTKRIGYAYDKRISTQGGRNGCSIAQFFNYPESSNHLPIITGVSINLNTVNLKKSMTVTVGDTTYVDGIMHVAKLRVDLRNIDPSTGGPGESLVNGGVIYSLKDRVNLNVHKVHTVALPQAPPFPSEGVFVVLEWIVTDDIREQDTVSPSIWRAPSNTKGTSWIKWPVGTPWKRTNSNDSSREESVYCIGLEVVE